MAVVSTLYLKEVASAPSPLLRYQLNGIPDIYGLEIQPFTPGCEELAEAYLSAKAFTESNRLDASHVATAAHHGCDVVVSWNFQHIVRAWTMKLVAEVHQNSVCPPS